MKASLTYHGLQIDTIGTVEKHRKRETLHFALQYDLHVGDFFEPITPNSEALRHKGNADPTEQSVGKGILPAVLYFPSNREAVRQSLVQSRILNAFLRYDNGNYIPEIVGSSLRVVKAAYTLESLQSNLKIGIASDLDIPMRPTAVIGHYEILPPPALGATIFGLLDVAFHAPSNDLIVTLSRQNLRGVIEQLHPRQRGTLLTDFTASITVHGSVMFIEKEVAAKKAAKKATARKRPVK